MNIWAVILKQVESPLRLVASYKWYSCVVVAVCELWSPSMSDFLEGLESSGWLKHIKAVMDAGIFIAKVSVE